MPALFKIFRLLGEVLLRLLKHPRVRCLLTQTQSHLTRLGLSHFETSGGLGRRRRLWNIPAGCADDVVLVTAVRQPCTCWPRSGASWARPRSGRADPSTTRALRAGWGGGHGVFSWEWPVRWCAYRSWMASVELKYYKIRYNRCNTSEPAEDCYVLCRQTRKTRCKDKLFT